ncbi:MAG TPA: MbnP family protein [Chitinophagaceae bacterium]|jgi:hypothetical protein|nr:MbnP family protein [Chitinophagaceae bacterium]
MKLLLHNKTTKGSGAAKCIAVLFLVTAALNAGAQLKQNSKDGDHLTLTFRITAGDQPLVPGNTYTNPFGEQYTVKKFRYYITQLQFLDSNSTSIQFFPDDYFIIDAGDSGTQTITIPLSIKKITSMSFLIGVDSVTNVSGVQTGALDPANGMFWTWNTGYITLKLQATSPAALVPANEFTFDVGGYKHGENVSRKIEFRIHHKRLVHNIEFKVDVNKLFNGKHNIKIAEHPMCHEPGPLAMQLADNYATMFSIQQLQ